MTPHRKQYLRQYQNEWIKRRRAEWFKEVGPCRSCGSSENLEVDHIDPSQKVTHRLWGWREDRRRQELAKCQPLCRGCHQEKSAKYLREFGPRGEANARPQKLTKQAVRRIRELINEGVPMKDIAAAYGVSYPTVFRIKSKEMWSYVS